MRALMWFRVDLRVADNAALYEACARATRGVVAVWMPTPGQWNEHDCADVKIEFWLRNVRALSEKLAALNIPLLIREADRFDEAPAIIAKLAEELGCDAVFANREYEVNERRRDERVRSLLNAARREFHLLTDQTILEPGSVTTGEGKYYTVFSPFKRAMYKRLLAEPFRVYPTPKKQTAMVCPADAVPAAAKGFDMAKGRPDLWKAGEDAALERLETFAAQRIEGYKDERNTPSVNGTSVLSPYLVAGCISPRQCVRAALDANGGQYDKGSDGAVHWISEVIWREFYKHLLIGFPRLCMGRAFKLETERLAWAENSAGFKAWCEGRTGVPIVDAAMRQMLQTGWMHNRLRMITAMYLTKDLFISWRDGERYFMQNLVDGDLGPNNGGWQWSASTGTDAAPYFRIFNPVSQSRSCDPEGVFIRRFVPELKDLSNEAIHEPWTLPPAVTRHTGYPAKPVVDHAEARDRVLAAFKALKA